MPIEDLRDDVRMVRTPGRHVTRVIAAETLIVPIAGGTADLEAIFTLNPVGSRIWELLEQPIAVTRLIETVVQEYDVSAAEAQGDVTEFLKTLREAGLIAPAEERG